MSRGKDPVKFDPDWCIHPGTTLRDWREENGLGTKAAATCCGRMPVDLYERVEAGTKRISIPIADGLAHGTGIPARLWLNLEVNFRAGLKAGKTWSEKP